MRCVHAATTMPSPGAAPLVRVIRRTRPFQSSAGAAGNAATRIDAYVDREIEGMGAAFRHAARMKVTTRDGRTFEKLILDRRGSAVYNQSGETAAKRGDMTRLEEILRKAESSH